MTRIIVRTAGVVLAASLSLSAQGKTFRHEIKASPGQTLDLRLGTGGELTIIGSDDASVRVEATFGDRNVAAGVVSARPTSRGVEVVSEWAALPQRGGGLSARFTVRVPRRFDLRIESTGGNLHVENVEGQIQGATRGGNLALVRLSGAIDLTTGGGAIYVSNSRLDGKVATLGGSVTLEDVDGHFTSVSMNGSVVSRTGRRSGGAAPGPSSEVRITTTGGAVNVDEAMAGATVTTTGGAIRIQKAAGHVKADTTGGEVRLDTVDGWIEATAGGNVVATMVGDPERGDRHVRLVSTGGDITLTVPEALGMRFDIKVAYTRNSRQNYEIRSDFPLQIRRTAEWEYATGDRRRYVYGTGTAGSGRHLVHIETVNGDVIIRKAP